MIRLSRLVTTATPVLAAPLVADAPQAASSTRAAITTREIDGHLRLPSHDLLEWLSPATRGGEFAGLRRVIP
jgi:hypothetical protein